MNRRTLKKKCKRAMQVLIEVHGYPVSDFARASSDETLDAPPSMEKRFVRSSGFFSALKGTWLRWYQCSYEYDEWECELPSEKLREIEFYASMTDEEAREFFMPK
jgi:hypothetical protein